MAAIAVWTVAVGLLMVSEIPSYSFKKFKLPGRFLLPIMAVVGLAAAGIAGRPWVTLFMILIVYLATIPLAFTTYRKLEAEAAKLEGESDDKDDNEGGDGENGDDSNTEPTPLRPVS